MGHIKEEAGSEPRVGFGQWMGPNQGLGGVSMGQDLDWGRGRIGSVGGVGAGVGVGFPQCALSPTQIRASRLEQIDKELLSAQDRVQQTEPQVPGGAESGP